MAALKNKARKATKTVKKAAPARNTAAAKAKPVKAKKVSVKTAKPRASKAKPAKAKAITASKKPIRKLISSGSAWEPILGYSRAVRVGDYVHVSGTTGADANDFYGQTKEALEKILAAVAPEGVKAAHAVRTRIFVTDISQWKEVARAHGEVFSEIRPANTLVEVAALIDPKLLVEIEADFFVP